MFFSPGLNLDHLEIFFASTAFRTSPSERHVFPPGTWWDTVFRPTLLFLVNEATDHAHVSLHGFCQSTLLTRGCAFSHFLLQSETRGEMLKFDNDDD